MNIKNVNDLRKAYPELVNEIIREAKTEERVFLLDIKKEDPQRSKEEIEFIAMAANFRR